MNDLKASGEDMAAAAQIAEWLKDSQTRIFFTGAGISTESGISDFRSPGGVWQRHKPVYYQEFLSSSEARIRYWRMKREGHAEFAGSKPNAGHLALARLEKAGLLQGLITQNIDGLHQDAGSGEDRIIELHGTNRRAYCLTCARIWPIEAIMERIDAGEEEPICEDCGGYIKPATVAFGQPMPQRETRRAFEWSEAADFFMAIGSSLVVHPAAAMPEAAKRAGARLVILNRDPTPLDDIADLVVRDSCGAVLSEVAEKAIDLN